MGEVVKSAVTIHQFEDDHGGRGDLDLGPQERGRLRAHAKSDQSDSLFLLRKTEAGRLLVIIPYIGSAIDWDVVDERSSVDLSTGGQAQLSLETYQRFVDDVSDDKPGVHRAEYIEGTTPNL
jgi:hypothetical protein